MGPGFIIDKSINLQCTNLQFTIESCNSAVKDSIWYPVGYNHINNK